MTCPMEYNFNSPPNVHRCNASEREIRTWKDHFISGLRITHKNLTIYLWGRFVPQDNITLNLLRKSRLHPNLSAYEELEVRFVYKKTPLFHQVLRFSFMRNLEPDTHGV